MSRIERGLGGTIALDAWQRLGLAVGRPLVISVQRDIDGETVDAGHLALQELVLREGRAAGYTGRFELPSRPAEPWRSSDIGLLDRRGRRLILVECWNSIGDLGAATRSSNRKRVETEAAAIAMFGTSDVSIGTVWVVRRSARNQALIARYPEIFLSAFPGSSQAWLRALSAGAPLPTEPGIVWADVSASRLIAFRHPARR